MIKRIRAIAFGLGAALFLGSTSAPAETVDSVEITRDAVDIARPHPEPPAVESVLVFSNRSLFERYVFCVAWNKNGHVVGRAHTRLPAMGVRYLLASDFGGPFLGSARCITRGRIVANGFLLAPGLTNLPVETASLDQAVRMRFDLLAYQP